MSTGEKKPAPTPATPPPTSSPPAKPAQPLVAPAKPTGSQLLSRRTFLKAAIGASVVLAGASMATSGEILSPLIPAKAGELVITNAVTLESMYDTIRGQTGKVAYQFFYWPYDASVSPYYKNALVRLPDELLDPSIRGSAPNLAHYDAWNLTCVHLRCLVNPGYDAASGQYRLQCPCHGSQYLMTNCCRSTYPAKDSNTAYPVAGPAYDLQLGFKGLPRVILRLDPNNNNIIATDFDGDPGIGRQD
jgi:Rieske Fe-S protein